MVSIGGFSTLLFVIGVVSMVACSLHIVFHVAMTKTNTLADLTAEAAKARGMFFVEISPLTVEKFAFILSIVSLLIAAVFALLDMVGMIVLRSRMWKYFASNRSKGVFGWQSSEISKVDFCQDWHSNAYSYEIASRQPPVAWWRRWVLVEELVYGVQRNMGFIRLSAALLLALLWSPIIVQLVIVGYAGQCRLVVRHSVAGQANIAAFSACDLLRKALVVIIFIWGCWTLMAVLLLFVNTNSGNLKTGHNLWPHQFAAIPMPLDVDDAINNIASTSCGQMQQNTVPTGKQPLNTGGPPLQTLAHLHPNQGYHYPYQQAHHPFASTANTTGQKEPSNTHYRASWSHTDGGESIVSDMSKLEAQSMLHPQGKHHLAMQQSQQNMLQQFYHPQSHPHHSLNQFQPPSRILEEQFDGSDMQSQLINNLALSYSSAQRRARSAFYKAAYAASISGMADPLVNTTASSAVYTTAIAAGNIDRVSTYKSDTTGEKRISRDSALRQYQMQQYRNQSGIGSERAGARSLARLSYENCDGDLVIAGFSGGGSNGGLSMGNDSKTKRNTIG
ncbi:hypothetical protein GGI25_002686 [Coemansia spiralis]|uniref:Uncharacterized protein n=2 Tax=Coemansia TaxID=4863 RepID=A0A9W8G8G0_9FUNG|nr:hypothetical protein EDC05_002508 [Coemansia umbellata]KAJ2622811.1 hypothetical protein GGI26_002918 [Coemansia sp. RSA 1358]KAJ2678043.1 hypothetical protein GGI25_002686 [Coemansia spiralis]